MSLPLLGKHFIELQSASTPVIAVAATGSFIGQLLAVIQAAPLWLYVVAALAPWIPILVLELVWTARHYRWLALFCLLLVTQSAYLLEHVAQVIQVTLLRRGPADAPGIFGVFGVERVQLLWASWCLIGLLLLASRFRRNRWLWLTLAVGALDFFEHVGGLADGRPVIRLAIAALEIGALNVAFAQQLGRTYDAWLARAFPRLAEDVLIQATGHAEELRLRPGERIERQEGRYYVITYGRGALLRSGPGGHDILLRVLGPGQVVYDEGTLTLCAETRLELLAVPLQ